MDNPTVLGIDIGTTTVSAVLLRRGKILRTSTAAHGCFIASKAPGCSEQNAQGLLEKAADCVSKLIDGIDVAAIGVTGQMHGIVYTGSHGAPVSPLFTWQDCRGAKEAREIEERTGVVTRAGYGMATHAYNRTHSLVPNEAESFCTIADALVMKLTGNRKPLVHATNFESLGGIYDTHDALLPRSTDLEEIAGYYRNIPVCVAVGDNQASFFASVADEENTALANIGTGSQISAVTSSNAPGTRTYFGGKRLAVGASLCGGRAYSLLEKLLREASGKPMYDVMNASAAEVFANRGHVPTVSTLFCGTREDETLRGSIHAIGEDDLTIGKLSAGFLTGIAEELFGLYRDFGLTKSVLAASGNAVRSCKALRTALEKVFGTPPLVPSSVEEAAAGAAYIAMKACNYAGFDEIKSFIEYERA